MSLATTTPDAPVVPGASIPSTPADALTPPAVSLSKGLGARTEALRQAQVAGVGSQGSVTGVQGVVVEAQGVRVGAQGVVGRGSARVGRARTGWRASLLLAVLLALTACTGAGEGGDEVSEGFVSGDGSITQIAPDQREAAPELSGPTLEGGTFDLADHQGEVVVLNVWASWCAPCRAEAPDLVAAADRTADLAQFVGLNAKEDNPDAERAYLRAFEVDYPNVDDPTGDLQLRFADNLPPMAIPSTLVIDGEGRVAARILGPISEGTLVDLVTDVSEGR